MLPGQVQMMPSRAKGTINTAKNPINQGHRSCAPASHLSFDFLVPSFFEWNEALVVRVACHGARICFDVLYCVRAVFTVGCIGMPSTLGSAARLLLLLSFCCRLMRPAPWFRVPRSQPRKAKKARFTPQPLLQKTNSSAT